MARVSHFGYGVWCYRCQKAYDNTSGCDHDLGQKDGIQKQVNGSYLTQPADMGHFSPHMFIDVDGYEQCAECGATKIPEREVLSAGTAENEEGE